MKAESSQGWPPRTAIIEGEGSTPDLHSPTEDAAAVFEGSVASANPSAAVAPIEAGLG